MRRVTGPSSPLVRALGITGVVGIAYLFTRRTNNPFDQYVALAEALIDGRLHIEDPEPWLELAEVGGRHYVIDPPAPALLLLPFVAVWGRAVDAVLVSVVAGAAAAGLAYLAGRRLFEDEKLAAALAILVGLGTNLWWAATDAGLWSFAHTAAVLFSMAALAEASGRGRPWLVGTMLGLAGLSRLPVFATAPLFVFLLTAGRWRPGPRDIRRLAGLAIPLLVAAGAYLAYNQARYGTWRDLGYYHGQYSDQPWFEHGRIDVRYLPRHIHAIFFAGPEPLDAFPWLRPSAFGMALVMTSPALLYAFRAPWTPRTKAAVLALALAASPALLHGTTGWTQFGYRFSLDWIAPLVVLVGAGMRRIDGRKIAVIAVCVLVNLWGTLAFNRFDWVAN